MLDKLSVAFLIRLRILYRENKSFETFTDAMRSSGPVPNRSAVLQL